MTHSIFPYLYNALQIQLHKLVQSTSNCYAADLKKKYATEWVVSRISTYPNTHIAGMMVVIGAPQ